MIKKQRSVIWFPHYADDTIQDLLVRINHFTSKGYLFSYQVQEETDLDVIIMSKKRLTPTQVYTHFRKFWGIPIGEGYEGEEVGNLKGIRIGSYGVEGWKDPNA